MRQQQGLHLVQAMFPLQQRVQVELFLHQRMVVPVGYLGLLEHQTFFMEESLTLTVLSWQWVLKELSILLQMEPLGLQGLLEHHINSTE